ncbi:hypothetical protein AA21952_2506 [Acetobacter oeni LMG 21952]|nr:hypothetical protein AA21952_2506 [Acetobacter oeni LMG 21952]
MFTLLQPFEKMSGQLRKRTHIPGRNIEQMTRTRRGISNPDTRDRARLDNGNLRTSDQPAQMNRKKRPAGAPANDNDGLIHLRPSPGPAFQAPGIRKPMPRDQSLW